MDIFEWLPDGERLLIAYDTLTQRQQQVVDDAIANRYYKSYADAPYTAAITINGVRYLFQREQDDPIFSEFNSESVERTIDHPSNPTSYPYMQGVSDPISSHPTLDPTYQRHGLSQHGASRWAKGDMGWNLLLDRVPWSVRWTRAAQILTHYYTSIHLRDAGKNNQHLTPAYRWVSLEIKGPAVACVGNDILFQVRVQNTGTSTWDVNTVRGCASRIPRVTTASAIQCGAENPAILTAVKPGEDEWLTMNLDLPTGPHNYLLDLYSSQIEMGFSQQSPSWPQYVTFAKYQIRGEDCQTFSKKVYLPLVQTSMTLSQ
ncbi:hypothetical protein KFU94_18720 [Chloroflexi bacterium TSY]|nr:hypothetical protein [Chloroflexi bacterium TSY]